MTKPEKPDLGHLPGQGDVIQNPLALNRVSHGNDNLILLGQPISIPECLPPHFAGGKEIRIHAVCQAVNRFLTTVSQKEGPGVVGGSDNDISHLIAPLDPPFEQRGKPVRSGEGPAEILHGGVGVVDDPFPREAGNQGSQKGVGEHRVDVDDVPLTHGPC